MNGFMAPSIVTAPLSSLTGVIERNTFHSSELGYNVAQLNTGNIKQLIMDVAGSKIETAEKLQKKVEQSQMSINCRFVRFFA